MIAMMNATIENGKLKKTQGLAVEKLIPKKSEALRPSDFRPISLLWADYKLMAGILAERLKLTLPATIGERQRGGVPGRNFLKFIDVFEGLNRKSERIKNSRRKDWSSTNCT